VAESARDDFSPLMPFLFGQYAAGYTLEARSEALRPYAFHERAQNSIKIYAGGSARLGKFRRAGRFSAWL